MTLTVRLQSRECLAQFTALIAGVGLATDCAGLVAEVVGLQTALLGELLVTEVAGKRLGEWERFVDHAVDIQLLDCSEHFVTIFTGQHLPALVHPDVIL